MLPLEQSPLFFAVAAFAVFFVALAKAGFGGIIGSLAMPLVAAASDTVTAIAVLLPTYLLMDVVVVWIYRRTVPWRMLWPMLLAGAVGTVLAALVYGIVQPEALGLVLGGLAIVSAGRFGLQKLGKLPPPRKRRDPDHLEVAPMVGWMGAAGFFSFFLMGAVPSQVYLIPFRLEPRVHVSLTASFFAATNWSRLPILLQLDVVRAETLVVSACLLPMIPLGIVTGRYITNNLRKEPFFVAAQSLLFVLGLYLIGKALVYFAAGAG